MLGLLRAAELPLPVRQAHLCGYRVDFFWPLYNLVLEVDGYGFHGDRAAFERDSRRDQVLGAAGIHVIRVTYQQLRHRPYAVIARIAQTLARIPQALARAG
jgi:very-short-patch-repair endonuclease